MFEEEFYDAIIKNDFQKCASILDSVINIIDKDKTLYLAFYHDRIRILNLLYESRYSNDFNLDHEYNNEPICVYIKGQGAAKIYCHWKSALQYHNDCIAKKINDDARRETFYWNCAVVCFVGLVLGFILFCCVHYFVKYILLD